MEIWLDTCDRNEILNASRFGFIYGITTNPSILASTDEDPEKIINTLLTVQDGPVAVQVISDNSNEMIEKAQAIHSFSDRLIVKLPVTQQGLIAIRHLVEQQVPTMATAAFQPSQILLASLAGASYVAPYVGRMPNAGIDVNSTIQSMYQISNQNDSKTKIIAAVKTVDQIVQCAKQGIAAVTIKPALFKEFLADDKFTLEALQGFDNDWNKRAFQSPSLLNL